MKLFIGLMSGTSMDGIDVALVDATSNTFIHGITCPYSPLVKRMILDALSTNKNSLGYYSQLNTMLGREFARAVLDLLEISKTPSRDIVAIGSHGQTLCHDTTGTIPYTVQSGCAHTIAELTGITVVADFRTRDLVAGGQGAPFAPIYHQAIFQDQGYPLAVVNVGGIANLSWLQNAAETSGYDLGPGNCLMDAWISKHQQLAYDEDGAWAASGNVIDSLLTRLLEDSYFQRPQPKSVGKEYFSLEWLSKYITEPYASCDVQATLLQLTAHSIANGVKMLPHYPLHVLLCGGGAHNKTLLHALTQLLPHSSVTSTQAFNVNPDFIEASMFAWLAQKTLDFTPLNLGKITGAKYPAILGAIYPAGIDKGKLPGCNGVL